MSSITVAHNPFKHHFVRSLMKEPNADEDAQQKAFASPDIPSNIFATDLAFMVLSLFSLVLAALYFCVALTGYDWYHSVTAIIENTRTDSVKYTMFKSNEFDIERASEVLFVDCFLIFLGSIMTTVAIYQSHKRKLIWGYVLMVIGIGAEIGIVASSHLKAGDKCDGRRFGERLDELLHWYLEGNRTKMGYSAVNKLNSLQFSIVCCGKNGYKDYKNGEIPSSCCVPAWAQNAYCAHDIVKIGNQKLIDSRLNHQGCLRKALDLCERILDYFTDFMLILILFRIIIGLLQGVVLFYELKFYKVIITEEIIKAENAPALIPLHEDDSVVSAEPSITPSVKSSKPKTKPGTPLKGTLEDDEATERYLLILRGKGHGMGFEKELAAIERRRREAAAVAEIRRLQEEAIRVERALAAEKKKRNEEKKMRLKEAKLKRLEKLRKKRSRSKAKLEELIKRKSSANDLSTKHKVDGGRGGAKPSGSAKSKNDGGGANLAEEPSPKSKTTGKSPKDAKSRSGGEGGGGKSPEGPKPRTGGAKRPKSVKSKGARGRDKSSSEEDDSDNVSVKSVKHNKKHGRGRSRNRHKARTRAKSEFIDQPLWAKSEGDLLETHKQDVAHTFVGGTGGQRALVIQRELDVQPRFSIFDEDETEEELKKLKKKLKKKKKKAGKKSEEEPEFVGSQKPRPQLRKRRKAKRGKVARPPKHKRLVYSDWQDFW